MGRRRIYCFGAALLIVGLLMPPATAALPASGSGVDADLWALVQADWRQADKLAAGHASYAAATARHLDKARLLLADLRHNRPASFLAEEAKELDRLAQLARRTGADLEKPRSLYLQVRWLKRHIALANPLLDFGKMVFVKRVPTSYSHLVMQYFGWRARPGGGIFILDKPGYSLACRDILDGKLAGGNVLEPRLSWDAKKIVFSYVKCTGKNYNPNQLDNDSDDGFYHLHTVNVDGTDLRQLTDGAYDDLMPTWLPDGGIAFCSTRRKGYARCFGGQFSPRWHVYTLHRLDTNARTKDEGPRTKKESSSPHLTKGGTGGGAIKTLSYHDTNEWFPTVSHSGLILYARWDYIDRDAVTHQNLWSTRPDGTNPLAVWGNGTASPHCVFQPQPIPGSHKIVFTASAHHSITAGSIAILDPTVARDGQNAITRITPEVPFPEAESRNIPEYYAAPWPLSEKYFLVAYSPKPLAWEPKGNDPNALGLYLLDAFGNRELIYRDPDIGSTNPCPLTPRPTPPALASQVDHGWRSGQAEEGEMFVQDIYQGLGYVPRGTIKEVRIVQIFPKTTHVAGTPPVGLAGEENARAILGTVPVEADGSVCVKVPAKKALLFQALDQDGFAYQTMRSLTYVQPGERVSCIGCHEYGSTSPRNHEVLALRKPPTKNDPGDLGGRPFSFVEVVQPILDRHCVNCHGGAKIEGKIDLTRAPAGPFTKSYVSLCGDRNFWGAGTNPKNAAEALVPRFGARNQIQVTPPGGMYGARGSRLIKLLKQGHHQVQLSADDYRRLGAWIDMNAIFYGVNLPADQARQLRGERIAMPAIE